MTKIVFQQPGRQEFLKDVVEGLAKEQKSVPPKYFYDQKGSELFDEICELDEYYLTRTEVGLLTGLADELKELLPEPLALFEYGSGAGAKIRILLDKLPQIKTWVPIEICQEHLAASAASLRTAYPQLNIVPICGDYMKANSIDLASYDLADNRMVFFPGSTIGNLTQSERLTLLANSRRLIGRGGFMLMGIDLVKDEKVLIDAYDDDSGVTAAFNKNLLRRINRELGANFDAEKFKHEARYNDEQQRIEMHLVAEEAQLVQVDNQVFKVAEGESIHTECSHKFSFAGIQQIAELAGFELFRTWSDQKGYFGVVLLRAK